MKSSDNELVSEWNEDASLTKWQTGDLWNTVVPQAGGATPTATLRTVTETVGTPSSGKETPLS